MAVMFHPWPPQRFIVTVFLFILISSSSYSQTDSPQNIETFFPGAPLSPPPPLESELLPPLLPLPPLPPSSPPSKSIHGRIRNAALITAATTLVVATMFFFLLQKCVIAPRARRKEMIGLNGTIPPQLPTGAAGGASLARETFGRFDGNVKGLIVDENGLDVLYWRKLQGQGSKRKETYQKEKVSVERDEEEGNGVVFRVSNRRSKKPESIQDVPLLRGHSSNSTSMIHSFDAVEKPESSTSRLPLPIPPYPPSSTAQSSGFSAPPPPPPPQPPAIHNQAISAPPPPPPPPIPAKTGSGPPPPPPIPPKSGSVPPPPPPIPRKTGSTPPPPPPIPGKTGSGPPPPPPRKVGALPASSSSKPPSIPFKKDASTGDTSNQKKLKPLHWDKVNADASHSMVWDRIDGGSFSFDGDMMEALFGYVATNKKPPLESNSSGASGSSAQTFILDPRKSQNTAIVLKSLTIPREEIIDVLLEGQHIDADSLEKLTRISPTQEEQMQILRYDGDPSKLAYAETFLFQLLKAVPSAFTRLNAIYFKSYYPPEINHFKENLKTLESGCQELRTKGLFMKLLEAILKAGNRMNAGTARGNAQAFNLTALRKLSDVKSIDGKTSLLNFVVEEVVRSEGKRCVLIKNRSNSISSGGSSSSGQDSEISGTLKEDRETEYLKLGLPLVGGLSAEFVNVKKAALIDYDVFSATISSLTARVKESKQLLTQKQSDDDGFMIKMKAFIESAEEELKQTKEEQTRVIEFVKKTTEYYQAGAFKDPKNNPFQLFAIIKDFLGMVDQVCIDISKNLQKRRTTTASSSTAEPPPPRNAVRFPILPANFMSEKLRGDGSDSDID